MLVVVVAVVVIVVKVVFSSFKQEIPSSKAAQLLEADAAALAQLSSWPNPIDLLVGMLATGPPNGSAVTLDEANGSAAAVPVPEDQRSSKLLVVDALIAGAAPKLLNGSGAAVGAGWEPLVKLANGSLSPPFLNRS